ncbi:MAG: hypothetical protein AAGM45_00015 [Cyanobacteria bacterium J06588_5]
MPIMPNVVTACRTPTEIRDALPTSEVCDTTRSPNAFGMMNTSRLGDKQHACSSLLAAIF